MRGSQVNGTSGAPRPAALVTVRAFELAAVDPELQALLGSAEQGRAAQFTDLAARREFIAGRVVQRILAAQLLGLPPETLQDNYWCPECGARTVPSHGRPGYLVDHFPAPLSLSLSRSHGWALAAMVPSAGVRIGVDVQDIGSVGFEGFDGVALSPAETATLARVAPGGRNAWRAAVWARKEALAKHSGLGLRTGPAAINAFPHAGSEVAVWNISAAGAGLPGTFAAAVAIDVSYGGDQSRSGFGKAGRAV